MQQLWSIANRWATASDAEVSLLKSYVKRIVGYDCKINTSNGRNVMNIFVIDSNADPGNITDVKELLDNFTTDILQIHPHHGFTVHDSMRSTLSMETMIEQINEELLKVA